MTLNKNTLLKYVYNGTYYNIKVIFSRFLLDKIPLYISKDINTVTALQLSDGSIIIIINEDFYNKADANLLELNVMLNILKVYYKDCESDSIIDVCCAYWYGFNTVINNIRNMSNISDIQKRERINFIESIMLSNRKINIPEKNYIVENVKYVNII